MGHMGFGVNVFTHTCNPFKSAAIFFFNRHMQPLFFIDSRDIKFSPVGIIIFTLWWIKLVILKPWNFSALGVDLHCLKPLCTVGFCLVFGGRWDQYWFSLLVMFAADIGHRSQDGWSSGGFEIHLQQHLCGVCSKESFVHAWTALQVSPRCLNLYRSEQRHVTPLIVMYWVRDHSGLWCAF